MMNALSMAVYLDHYDDVTSALALGRRGTSDHRTRAMDVRPNGHADHLAVAFSQDVLQVCHSLKVDDPATNENSYAQADWDSGVTKSTSYALSVRNGLTARAIGFARSPRHIFGGIN